ncbi:L-lactate dehydrogenase [Candidatus Peregrinibacteria bacterium]|nr:L-lactate dehydrogenase [Candidatus Peregrinibacteria bacterium]
MEYHRFSNTPLHCTFKVSIIGCGNVGATAAYALLLDGTPTDLTLIDVNKEKAQGILLDLEHCLPFTSYTKLEATDDLHACEGSQLIIITAGKKQAPGETRLDLIKANRNIFQDIIPKIAAAAPNAILLIVSNPVDILTHEALTISEFPSQRVFGSGTILDTARLQFHISEKIHIHPRSIDAYVLGEHGDSSFPVFSSATVVGKHLFDFPEFTKEVAEKCYENTKNAAYRIIHDVGFTCYSIATAIREITRSIFEDTHQVFMLSTLLQNYYGHSDVSLSVPCVLGRKGILNVLEIPLDPTEQEKLKHSVTVLKSARKT